MGAFMQFERERKNGRRVRKKKMGGGREKMRPVKLNSLYSKSYHAFIYTG